MRRPASIVLLLAVFLVGLALGAWFSSGRNAAAFTASAGAQPAASAHAAGASETARGFPSGDEMFSTIMSAVSEKEPLLRAHRLHDAMAKLGAAELSVFFEKAVKVQDRERREALLKLLLRRWVAVDLAAAQGAVQPFVNRVRRPVPGGSGELDEAINQAWAGAFPEQMLADALAAPFAGWARETASAALESLTEGDRARQLERLARLPASRLRAELCEKAIVALAQKDSAAAEAHLDLLTEPRQRARTQAEILGELAARDPAAGLARLTALASEFKGGNNDLLMVTLVLTAVAGKDAAAAVSAVGSLPDALQPQALAVALVGWAEKNPVDALTWGAANGVDLNDARRYVFNGGFSGGAWQPLLSVAFDRDRAGTLDWLRTLSATAERDAMLRNGIYGGRFDEKLQIYAELTPAGQAAFAGEMLETSSRNNDTGQFEPWVKSLSAGAARQAAVRSLVASQIELAPERMDAIPSDWPAGPDRDAALRSITFWLPNDPRRALDFARRVHDPTAREPTFDMIARRWLNSDKPAARAWIASAPELSAEQKRVLLGNADER